MMVLVNLRCTGCRKFRIELDVKELGDVESWAEFYNQIEKGDNPEKMECFYCSSKLEKTAEYEYMSINVVDEEEIGIKFGKEHERRQEFRYPDEDFEPGNMHVRRRIKNISLPKKMTAEEASDYIMEDKDKKRFVEEIEDVIRDLEREGMRFPNREVPEEVEVDN